MKLKRILALAGAVLLCAMYACTLIFAVFDHSATMGLFKASVACTVIVPVLLYAYILVYRVLKPDSGESRHGQDTAQKTECPGESGESDKTDKSGKTGESDKTGKPAD